MIAAFGGSLTWCRPRNGGKSSHGRDLPSASHDVRRADVAVFGYWRIHMQRHQEGDKAPRASTGFVQALERETGESIEQLRNMTIDDRRRMLEKRPGFITRFASVFPFIGRGNVMRDRVLSREEVNEILDESLR